MALTKRCYNLFLPPPDIRHKHPQAIRSPKPSASTNLVPLDPSKRKQTGRTGSILDLTLQPLRVMPRQTTKELVVAHAAAELPTQYAILRTLMRELQSRYGWDAPENQGRIQIVDFAALYGASAWASVATLPSPAGKKNALVLIENNSVASDFSRELLTLDTPGPLATWSTLHFRSFAKYASSALAPRLRKDKSVGVLAFALSALVDPKERRRKLKEVWNSGVEMIVVAEMGHRDGWTVVEEAREYLLGLGREELAVGQDQAGEYTPPSPPVQKDEQPVVDTSTLTPLAPRPRGRRRPGERLRPATPSSDDAPLDTDVEAGQFGIDKNAGVFVDTRRKKEKFVFNGVEFEEEDRKSEQEESEKSEVVRWNDEGTQLVKDGRVLGCHIVAPVRCSSIPSLKRKQEADDSSPRFGAPPTSRSQVSSRPKVSARVDPYTVRVRPAARDAHGDPSDQVDKVGPVEAQLLVLHPPAGSAPGRGRRRSGTGARGRGGKGREGQIEGEGKGCCRPGRRRHVCAP